MDRIFGHSLPGQSEHLWESLADHTAATIDFASSLAAPIGWSGLLRASAQLHDVGKMSPEFQGYIRKKRTTGGDHSTAGARIARDLYGEGAGAMIAAIVAGHHAGLADADRLAERLVAPAPFARDAWEAVVGPAAERAALAPARMPKLDAGPKNFSKQFLLRMLFSCLVDADFLATEAFYAGARGEKADRGGHRAIGDLRDRLAGFMAEKRAGAIASDLNALRARILDHAVARASLPPGLFTLTVPTGGGKTLASLSFALEHAVRHGLARVIYVIPYTSIIEQTAAVFREALGTQDDILEHHANFDWEASRKGRAPDDEAPDAVSKLQRAAENWDVPVVVTTAVQFFESLFANRTSRCRKLHNIADSVVVLDEAQTIPLDFLLPCLASVDELARNYRSSVVFCTATQPAVRRIDRALLRRDKTGRLQELGLDIAEERELAPDPSALYERLRRTTVERAPQPVPDAEIAARFAERPSMLAIVNTRRHAQALYEAIRAMPGAAHLSTLMCPRHRRLKLAALKARLKAGEPARLVATSLIEAGVDISFAEVWRAMAGLESVAQAAGRCNREDELAPAKGRVVVFEPAEARSQHEIVRRWNAAKPEIERHADPLGPDAVRGYFSELYFVKGDEGLDAASVTTGRPGVLPAIADATGFGFPYASIAKAFRFIDEEAMAPVVVPWKAHAGDDEAKTLLDRVAAMQAPLTRDMRALQQYVVPIPTRVRADWLAKGVLKPVNPALGEAILRFDDLAHYREETGVEISDPTYRASDNNVFG